MDASPSHSSSPQDAISTQRKALPPLLGVLGIAALLSAFASALLASEADDRAPEPISPLPLSVNVDPRKVELGRRLFLEPRLSDDNTVSCAHCHPLDHAGVDGLPRSIGVRGSMSDFNAPSVFNSGLAFAQFWDGRAATLEEQVDGPVNNPAELASNWPQIIGKLTHDDRYREAFQQIYAAGMTADNIKDAIATFERSLITPDSRFDRYLRGDDAALDETEKAGYRLFKDYGCSSCHQGRLAGGNLYQKLGVVNTYFDERKQAKTADLGRFNVTGREADKFKFKVPGLRNVALTAPYLHDGSVETLERVVWLMGYHQLGRRISGEDIDRIVAFLKTLTGRFEPSSP
jgi:cytochrome c peroxidase